jgi:hypothetical protein
VVNWPRYKRSFVRRDEVVLDFDIIDKWDNALDKMNDGKEGALYRYPDSFVQLLGYMRAYFHLPYRKTEGVVTAHAGKEIPYIPDYSIINRRVNKLGIKINEKIGTDIIIALETIEVPYPRWQKVLFAGGVMQEENGSTVVVDKGWMVVKKTIRRINNPKLTAIKIPGNCTKICIKIKSITRMEGTQYWTCKL